MGPFRSQQVAPVWPYLLPRQIRRGNVSAFFVCHETAVKSNNRSRSFHVLVSLTRKILGIHSCSGNLCVQRFFIFIVSHFAIFTWRFNWFKVITNGGQICVQNFSLDIRAHCSAILVSRLLKIVHTIDFCGLQRFANIEVEDVVIDVDWNGLSSSVPTHQSFELHPHFMAKFAVRWNHETAVGSKIENLDVLCTRFLQHCTTLMCAPVSPPFRHRHKLFSS